jgi:hypothetical protein
MTGTTTIVFHVDPHGGVDTARQVYQAVWDLYYETNALDELDAVVVCRGHGDAVTIVSPPGGVGARSAPLGGGVLAAGLVAELYPRWVEVPPLTRGVAAKAATRLRSCLDSACVTVVVAATPARSRSVCEAIGQARRALVMRGDDGEGVVSVPVRMPLPPSS